MSDPILSTPKEHFIQTRGSQPFCHHGRLHMKLVITRDPPPPMYTRCLARDLRTYYYCLSYDDRWMQNVVQIACTADSIRTGPAEVNGVTCSPSCPNSSRSPTRTTSTWPCTLTGRRGRVDAPSGWRRNWRQGRKLMRYAPSLDKRIS